MNSLEHQVVVTLSPTTWLNNQRIYRIHTGPSGGTYGYCDLAGSPGVTVLVRQLENWPGGVVWQIVGWLRK